MDNNFKKQKKRAQIFWIVKSLIIGVSAAMLTIGAVLLGTCFAKVNLFWAWYILIGIGAFVIGGGIPALLLRVTDKSIAHELDKSVGRERVQTALAYSESEEGIHELQRQDASNRLASSKIEFQPLWVYILVPVLTFVVLLSGIFCTLFINKPTPPPSDNPYIFDDWQEGRLALVIEYVQDSDADDYTKTGTVNELLKLVAAENDGITDSQIKPFVRDAILKIRSVYTEANASYPDNDNATEEQKQQKTINHDVGEYVVRELYTIFDIQAESMDIDDDPEKNDPNNGNGDEDKKDPNPGTDISGSQQMFFDPELGYVSYQEILQKYQIEINNALDSGLISSDDWYDIVVLYLQFLNGSN